MTWLCRKGDHYPDEAIVYVDDWLDPDGLGVLVEGSSGLSTNRWADGVAGVSYEIQESAEQQDEAWCPEHLFECFWQD